ncbi:MAG: efflux transporter outer membrane subunit [Myxococcales bacterium]|nr:efflux transporter outer membrane subunit [Myxococcales bacterium]MCB9520273.1 efflux transporter outer membrane subunit [Myxococcales bacterium]MCB9531359.1 efflux transporter outer membrane subunit [Myxococcales bacterium]MCB9533568.1 efflux transporter outer membrane subunit [Myxococcales bacterium]
MSERTLLLRGLVVCAVAGCAPRATTIPDATVEAPAAFSAPSEPLPDGVGAGDWWRAIGDPRLDALVGAVLAGSPTLAAADARLAQADAAVRVAGGALWPTVNLEANAARARTLQATPAGTQASTNGRLSLSLAASYELDVWGRIRGQRAAVAYDRDAAADDAAAVAVSLTAETVEAWLDAAFHSEREALTARQAATNRQLQELAVERLSMGLGVAADALQQRQAAEALDAQLPLIGAARTGAALRIAALTGEAPDAAARIELPTSLPALPPTPELGVPADLLLGRPDLHAAMRRAHAADARAAAAVADRLPSIRLSGSIGLQASSLADLFDDFVWNLAVGLVQPLIDGGRRSAEVDRTTAVVDERLAQLRGALIAAMREVEDALAREAGQRAYLDEIDTQLGTARTTLDVMRVQFGRGGVDYPRVLVAQQTLERLEQERLAAIRTLWSYRVALYRALGGDPRSYFSAAPGSPEAAGSTTDPTAAR